MYFGRQNLHYWLVLAMLSLIFAPVAKAQIRVGTPSSRFELSETVQLDRADGTALAHLERAKACLAEHQWDEAVETLRQVMENAEGKLLAVTPWRYVNLSDACQMQLAALPPEAWLIEGRTRAVARAAMKGRVPDPIRLRVRRGTQAPDWFLWARNRLPDYLRAVEDIGQSALVSEIIDVPLLRDRVSKWPLEQAAQRPPITDHSTTRAIGVGLFVRWWERRNAVV